MKSVGIFEMKTKLSEICDEVARTGESVIVTRRGKPLVRVTPADRYAAESSAVWEARESHPVIGDLDADFAEPERTKDPVDNPFSKEDK